MVSSLEAFEAVARRASAFTKADDPLESQTHPFDRRNIHPALPSKVKTLFDDGHYPEATFEAFKFIDKRVQHYSKMNESGVKLMMAAFDENKPLIKLTALSNVSEVDEQKGYRFMFSGGVMAIRNPRGHECSLADDPDTCLDHLAYASLLLRRLEASGFV